MASQRNNKQHPFDSRSDATPRLGPTPGVTNDGGTSQTYCIDRLLLSASLRLRFVQAHIKGEEKIPM